MANISQLAGTNASEFPTSEVRSSNTQVLGSLHVDESGNVYMWVDFQESMIAGEVVVVLGDGNFTASQVTSASKGMIGIVVATVSASDRFGYVQVYGRHANAIMTSEVTSSGHLVITATTDEGHFDEGATSDAQLLVHGAWATGASTTTTTAPGSATTGLGAVWLNFPYVDGRLEEIEPTT